MKLSSRLEVLRRDRSVSAWERESGIARGNLDRALKDDKLSEENIRKLCRSENVRADWLLFGEGAPYRIGIYATDASLAEQLQAHFDDECQRWTLTVVRRKSDGLPCAVTLTMPTERQIAAECTKDIALEVLAGPFGLSSAQVACRTEWGRVQGVALGDDVMLALCTGQIGTYALLFDPGYLLAATPLEPQALQILEAANGIASPPATPYQVPLSPPEQRLLNAYRGMSADDKTRLSVIADALQSLGA